MTLPVLDDSLQYSQAKTIPGRYADGVENVARLWRDTIGTGMFIGGIPVTYPLAKLYERSAKANEQAQERNSISSTHKPK